MEIIVISTIDYDQGCGRMPDILFRNIENRLSIGAETTLHYHVIKYRRTLSVDAWDIQPSNLMYYQKDRSSPKSVLMRHSRLYLKSLEVVNLGDSNIKAFDHVLVHGLDKVAPFATEKNGVRIAELRKLMPRA